MAKVAPAKLPEEVRNDPARQAEVAVFDAFASQLDDSFDVFYSVAWNGPTEERRQVQDGEADFVVGHPKHGFLVLEVKGGTIAFDPDRQVWTSTSRSGYVNKIHDPFEQARKSCHGILGRVKKLLSQGGANRIYHAAVFPHCLMRPEDLPGQTTSELTIDAEGVRELDKRIGRAFAYWRNQADLRGPAYEEIVGAIKRIHNRPVQGYRPMSLEIAEHHDEFDRLTADQMRVLDMVTANRRLLVRGCAGSGKTFVARRLAAKRSASGERVLVLCFNNLLGSLLEEELGGLPNVTATNFHALCEALAQSAGIPLPALTPATAATYYSSLAEAAMGALEAMPDHRFDSIIIDEAQDFELDWWIVVESLLAGGAASLTVFTDTNQLLYGASRGLPAEFGLMTQVVLPENVRNTQAIHREALRFYEGDTTPEATGPEGVAPQWIKSETPEAQVAQLEAILTRLTKEERVSPEDIVILTPKGATSTSMRELKKLGKQTIAPYEKRGAAEIGWSTVRKFKGLESPVVIITELDAEVAESERARELVYVGVTRARDFLYAIGTADAVTRLRGK